jgi:L-ascorbate metabolism protein UlaG (beta-lactamase superfamily)
MVKFSRLKELIEKGETSTILSLIDVGADYKNLKLADNKTLHEFSRDKGWEDVCEAISKKESENFQLDGKYHNLDNVRTNISPFNMIKWLTQNCKKYKDTSFKMPNVTNHKGFLKMNKKDTTITWIGHATFLIQMKGLNILTDPMFEDKMFTYNRQVNPGMRPDELPEIHVIILSHNHKDHLNFNSITKLKGSPLFLVPKGDAKHFRKKGLLNVKEYDWWEGERISGKLPNSEIEFNFVPSQHWSSINVLDYNSSRWGGWVITDISKNSDKKSIYFAGDTGYFRAFRDIGNAFDIDYALMPIGSYEPEWMMSVQHISPRNAIKAFKELKANKFIPMHYETFIFSSDTAKTALGNLYKEWIDANLPKQDLEVLFLGESINLSNPEKRIKNEIEYNPPKYKYSHREKGLQI